MTQRNVAAVVLWMMGTLLSFSAAGVGVRELSKSLGIFEILSLRNIAAIVILSLIGLARPGLLASVRPRRMELHLLRNVVHFGATYAWAVGITVLPLATVFALEFTAPAWVALFAVLVLGERMTTSRVGAILLGFLGTLIILRPGLATLHFGAFAVLIAAFGFAVSTIATKTLTGMQTTFAILFWMNVMQLPLNLTGSSWAFWTKLDASHIPALAGICIGGLSSHYCLTNAFRHGDATVVVPLDFLRIPLIALVGWSLYGERLDPFVFVGSLIIISGILWNLRAESRRG